ncbi:hypothetical protein LguiA_023488 [Lonicera macranthoides]
MGGFDDHVAIMGDWMPPSPSPRAFFSAMLGEDIGLRSFSDHMVEIENKEQILSGNADKKDNTALEGASGDQETKSAEQKTSSCGGLLERMAARAGFNVPRLNTENIRPAADLSQNPEIRSPYLTIPPGLSPTTLLDSPVFLSNSLVQPSPTTGKFQFFPNGNCRSSSMFITEGLDKNKDNFFDNINNSSFAFKPVAESSPSLFLGPLPPSTLPQQFFPNIKVSVQSENLLCQRIEPRKLHSENEASLHLQPDFSRSSVEKDSNNISTETRAFNTVTDSAEHSPPPVEQQLEDSNQRISGDTVNIGCASSEDGYNWRKYGQKQVKGSEYPRSYYKCTRPNCPVKKKVERSHEGNITEIIYKGTHNHPKPLPNRRLSGIGSSSTLSDMQFDIPEQGGPSGDVDPVWPTMQKDWRRDNLEVTSSAPLVDEYSNAPTDLPAQNGSQLELGDAVDRSSTFSNDEDEDECATRGSESLGCDGEGEESESKRRKVETYATDLSGASRTIREPRVVVQTTSEVDILDDGYRWRKYGQKVVKGNPNPRSYYKCTNAGCTVRKHVERASHDLKSVITTYEGKHNHDVPAARNSSHTNSNGPSQAAPQAQSHRPEPSQVQNNSMARFERPPHSLSSFVLPVRQQLGDPNGFGFGMNQPGLANLAMVGLGPNQGKLPGLPVHPYFGQARPISEMGFMLPKGEPKVEPMSEPGGMNYLGNGLSVYHQIMSRLPLGPQM